MLVDNFFPPAEKFYISNYLTGGTSAISIKIPYLDSAPLTDLRINMVQGISYIRKDHVSIWVSSRSIKENMA